MFCEWLWWNQGTINICIALITDHFLPGISDPHQEYPDHLQSPETQTGESSSIQIIWVLTTKEIPIEVIKWFFVNDFLVVNW